MEIINLAQEALTEEGIHSTTINNHCLNIHYTRTNKGLVPLKLRLHQDEPILALEHTTTEEYHSFYDLADPEVFDRLTTTIKQQLETMTPYQTILNYYPPTINTTLNVNGTPTHTALYNEHLLTTTDSTTLTIIPITPLEKDLLHRALTKIIPHDIQIQNALIFRQITKRPGHHIDLTHPNSLDNLDIILNPHHTYPTHE